MNLRSQRSMSCAATSRSLLRAFLVAGLAVLCFTTALSGLHAATLTVNVASRSGSLKKAGLGSLFGIVTNNNTATWKYYMTNSHLFVSEHQPRIGEGINVPPSTAAIAPTIRGTKIKTICRFGDLCYGWDPYKWPGLNNSWLSPGTTRSWLEQVTNAVNDIKSNYLDVVSCIAIFNEPDGQLWDTNFLFDPNIVGSSQAQRVNYVWTKTYQVIRAALPTVKIMGPNYVDYRPQVNASHQTMMRDFLTNAIATSTVPDVIGWHSLFDGNPTSLRVALLDYYRPLETSLAVPGAPLPMACEEYGINNGAFEGIPGQMVRYWAEFERAGVDIGCMGIYENGGDLANTMRYTYWDSSPEPNAGWHMMNWYMQMDGQYIPVTAGGMDGVASWNSTNQTLTVLLGGVDGNTSVQVNDVDTLGLGNNVRVRLDMAWWTTNSNVANTKISMGGDPQTGGYNLYDRNFALDVNGNITIPVNAVEGVYNGYRILITSSNASDVYPTKYEAEKATYNHVALHNGADGQYQSSGGAYIGGIDFTDSFVCFPVTASSSGLYTMLVRYAAGLGAASHLVTVNGQSQGQVNYPGTTGWANAQMRTATHIMSLVQGMNDVMLTRGSNYAEVDFIDVRPNAHRYDAELATNANVNLATFNTCYVPDCVGGINTSTSYVRFAVTVPVAGSYNLNVAYGNGGSAASHTVAVNGAGVGAMNYPTTGGWLGGGWLSGTNPSLVTRTSTLPVSLNAGLNTVQLTKSLNFAELDFITITPSASLTPAIPQLAITPTNSSDVALTWPTPANGYYLQQIGDPTKANWVNVSDPVTVVGNQNQVILPVASSNVFFRLFP